jgi:hypothetical protein
MRKVARCHVGPGEDLSLQLGPADGNCEGCDEGGFHAGPRTYRLGGGAIAAAERAQG